MEGKPSERELWEVTRMSRPALEAVIEQSLMLEPWKVVVAYCEHQRRGGTVPPRIANSFMVLVKDKGYEDVAEFVTDTMKWMGYSDYLELLGSVNRGESRLHNAVRESLREQPVAQVAQSVGSGPGSGTPNSTQSKEPWYDHEWIDIVLYLLLSPIGMYGPWSRKRHQRALENETDPKRRFYKYIVMKIDEGYEKEVENRTPPLFALLRKEKGMKFIHNALLSLITCGVWLVVWVVKDLQPKKYHQVQVSIDDHGYLRVIESTVCETGSDQTRRLANNIESGVRVAGRCPRCFRTGVPMMATKCPYCTADI